MARPAETVYLGRDNAIDLTLKVDGAAANLISVTRIDLQAEDCSWSVTSDDSPGAFDWTANPGAGYLSMVLGSEAIPEGVHRVQLVVYDPTNTEGVVWSEFRLTVTTACPPTP